MDVTWRMCVVLGLVATVTRSYEYDPNYLIPPHCKPCDAMACPILFYCAGTKVKDHCGCCERCSSDLFQPHAPPRTVPGAPNDGTGTETGNPLYFLLSLLLFLSNEPHRLTSNFNP